ncbi:unnamed protein product [Effrenium voratum]|nr:unnamed protein product [Effrenium voratum]
MPRPPKDPGDPGPDALKKSLLTLREQQERSLLDIEAFLDQLSAQEARLQHQVQNGFKAGTDEESETATPNLNWLQMKEAMDDCKEESGSKQSSVRKKTFGRATTAAELDGSKWKDLIDEESNSSSVRDHKNLCSWCKWLVAKPQFDWAMGMIIFFNSICIGIDTQKSISSELLPEWPGEALDAMFICIYVTELAIRLVANGRTNFKDTWFLFDLALVAMGLLGNILDPILKSSMDSGESALTKILVVRSLRLLRLVRAIRMLHMFRTVWRLVYGLLTSGNAMLSTFFILLLTLYIFACLGVEIITKDTLLAGHPDTAHIVEYYFGSLQRTLLTLVSFVSADSISAVYMPICIIRPELIIFFVAVILTVSVSLMNLVTAVLVEGALANAANDKELSRHDLRQKVKKFAPKIMEVFQEIDSDHSGTIDRNELIKINLNQLPFELNSEHVDSLEDLFDMLDVEGKGVLTQVEFADGLLNLLTMDVPIHQMKSFKLMQLQSATLEQIRSKLTVLEDNLPNCRRGESRGGSKMRTPYRADCWHTGLGHGLVSKGDMTIA